MKKGALFIVCIMIICSLFSLVSVSAITGSIGNARMILRAEVGDVIEKYVLVKNVNNVSLDIEISASGDLEKYITIKDKDFRLEPGEEKKAYFTIEASKTGSFENRINVKFIPEEGSGVGLSSTIILIVYGEGEMPDDADDNIDDVDVDNVEDETDNGNENKKMSTGLIIVLLTTGIVFLALVALLVLLLIKISKSKKKKGEEKREIRKLNKKERGKR